MVTFDIPHIPLMGRPGQSVALTTAQAAQEDGEAEERGPGAPGHGEQRGGRGGQQFLAKLPKNLAIFSSLVFV